MKKRLLQSGIAVPDILIPAAHPEKWAVIACDQFSSEPGYWEETRKTVGSAASALNLIIPECYLEDGAGRVDRANAAMKSYLDTGALKTLPPGFVLVKRSTPHVQQRTGLVLAIDLEAYDFSADSNSLIRPTEGTIQDRLPPRMAVRRDALLDLPHILILIDDPENRVMKAAEAAAAETVYDFDLMQGGGHISGQHVPVTEDLAAAFESLTRTSNLLFAVGDGNHSLASAREIWKEKKARGAPGDHPARFALAEVENIYDPGLLFHPIHRVMFNVDAGKLTDYLRSSLQPETESDYPNLYLVTPDGSEIRWHIDVPDGHLAAEPLQTALDSFLKDFPEADIDYIHGEDSVRSLVTAGRLGILLPPVSKNTFFDRITRIGPYPRKTFSIGEAVEKRYYLEARRL